MSTILDTTFCSSPAKTTDYDGAAYPYTWYEQWSNIGHPAASNGTWMTKTMTREEFVGCAAGFAPVSTLEKQLVKFKPWQTNTAAEGSYFALEYFACFKTEAEAAAFVELYDTYSGTCGTNLTWTLDMATGVLTISGTGAMTNWSSSSSYPWYSYRSSIKSVDIGDGVTSIGQYAFGNCTSLTSITVDENNTKYSSDERGVLFNKDKTTLIQYPIGNTNISYTIPDSVSYIGREAFNGCDSLTSVSIPDNVTSIGSHAFYSCSGLTSVVIPDGMISISPAVFAYCKSLTSVVIPDSVRVISADSFWECTSLTSIKIPDSVTTIGDSAFYYCISLASVEISDSVTSIGSGAFRYCHSLTDVYYTGTESEWNAITINSNNDPLTNATIHYNYSPYACGDINCDGNVNTIDFVILSRFIAGLSGYADLELSLGVADLDSSDVVDAVDSIILSRHLAKWSGYDVIPLA